MVHSIGRYVVQGRKVWSIGEEGVEYGKEGCGEEGCGIWGRRVWSSRKMYD